MNRPHAAGPIAALLLLLTPAAAQNQADRVILEAEQAREAGVPTLLDALKHGNPRAQTLAARALGRLEDPSHSDALIPLLTSPDPQVRRAAAGAFAQMRAPYSWAPILKAERNGPVRAAIFEAIGRAKPLADDAEPGLAAGLEDADPTARASAVRGLDNLFRLNSKPPRQPAAATLTALHQAFAADHGEEIRELILMTMRLVRDHDSATFTAAATDPSPQVRRLAAIENHTGLRDPSPIVRYEALKAAPSCDLAAKAVTDPSEQDALQAVDLLGTLNCDTTLLTPLLSSQRPWRIRAHALVALATADPTKAHEKIAAMAVEPTWQVRAYAANAARIANESTVLATLARDKDPNVAIAAMTTPEDATWALKSEHSGLIRAGAERLKNSPNLKNALPQLVASFNKLTTRGAMTVRDPRVAVLTRIGEIEDPSTDGLLREAVHDRDPAVAALAAQILTKRSGTAVAPQTTTLPVPALPPAEYIRGLTGATVRITMHGLGAITADLLTEEAPATVAIFAKLAEGSQYNGLTFHRIVPNSLIQGGSPGADEYDARSTEFMRDELGFTRNVRGTIGISTRGRDTGDAQIYVNSADNFRLDRNYTIFAMIRDGLSVLDRIQEGDLIDRIEILRHRN